MFVQVIKAKTSDVSALGAQLERWLQEVRPGAIGYVGSTVGISDDGTAYLFARFTDADSAAKNGGRPEQGAWWEQTAKLLDGEATFRESTDVSFLFDGGSDAATFVQVMEGTATDRSKAAALETPELLEQLRSARPDLLGGQRIWFDGGGFVEVAYFTSEADARKGETSAEFSEPQGDFEAAFGDVTYTDLRNPLLDSA
jgi:hypothetical protein